MKYIAINNIKNGYAEIIKVNSYEELKDRRRKLQGVSVKVVDNFKEADDWLIDKKTYLYKDKDTKKNYAKYYKDINAVKNDGKSLDDVNYLKSDKDVQELSEDIIIDKIDSIYKNIGQIIDDYNEIEALTDYLSKSLSIQDYKRNDILHKIELADFNEVEAIQYTNLLKKVSKQRRKIKDGILLKNKLSKLLDINSLIELEDTYKGLDNRKYRARVFKDLFND